MSDTDKEKLVDDALNLVTQMMGKLADTAPKTSEEAIIASVAPIVQMRRTLVDGGFTPDEAFALIFSSMKQPSS